MKLPYFLAIAAQGSLIHGRALNAVKRATCALDEHPYPSGQEIIDSLYAEGPQGEPVPEVNKDQSISVDKSSYPKARQNADSLSESDPTPADNGSEANDKLKLKRQIDDKPNTQDSGLVKRAGADILRDRNYAEFYRMKVGIWWIGIYTAGKMVIDSINSIGERPEFTNVDHLLELWMVQEWVLNSGFAAATQNALQNALLQCPPPGVISILNSGLNLQGMEVIINDLKGLLLHDPAKTDLLKDKFSKASALKVSAVLRIATPRLLKVATKLEDYLVQVTNDQAIKQSLVKFVSSKWTGAGQVLNLALGSGDQTQWLPDNEERVNTWV